MAEGDHPRALSRCRSLHLLYHTTTGTPLYHTYHTSTTPDSLAGRGPGLRAVVAVEVSDQASVSLDECFLGNTTGSLRWRAEWVRRTTEDDVGHTHRRWRGVQVKMIWPPAARS